ncbi:uncharacterized protein LOC129618349 [Condylostylus longicornis]|uniref:uncharacterized protein LOC129618349 n=1 Tax=Condylostylus longicornis TaxID=2530218 RepID=UPI00244DBBF4|nr:uncharacterized protein LOC129618349 [Condylostylus longicornis]
MAAVGAEPTAATSRIIVKNIPQYYAEDKLREFVQNRVGARVTDVRIPKDKNGTSRKFAFVGFVDAKNASSAIKTLQNTFLDTCKLNVSHAFAPGSSSIPRPWSRHAEGSSAFIRSREKSEQNKETRKEKKEGKKAATRSREVAEDPQKLEFLLVASKRRGMATWKDDFQPAAKKIKSIVIEEVKPTKAGVSSSRQHVEFADSEDDENDDEVEEDVLKEEEISSGATSVLDGLMREDEESSGTEDIASPTQQESSAVKDDDPLAWLKEQSASKPNEDVEMSSVEKPSDEASMETLGDVGRLMLLNLPYSMTKDELKECLSSYGELSEIHLCRDEDGLQNKGRAFVTFTFPEHAVKALPKIHHSIIQGRVVRAFPAQPKKEPLVVEKVAGGKKKASSSYKRQLEEKLKQRAEDVKTWNLLYVSANAATDAIAEQMGLEKRDILGAGLDSALDDRNDSVAARVALGETQLIQQTKQWLKKEGINISAFERKVRYCLAPSGTVAVVQFMEADHARSAFKRTAYSRFKNVPLFVEWAPLDIFNSPKPTTAVSLAAQSNVVDKEEESEKLKRLLDEEDARKIKHVSLFIKNLSFETTEEQLAEAFSEAKGFVRATIAKKKSVNAAGGSVSLSMG